MALIAGQQGTITYLTFAGGQPFNPQAGGGQVLSQALYPTAGRTGTPVATATQIVQTTTGAVLTYTAPVAGLYYALTQWQPSAGAPVVVDADDTVTVASFTGNLGPAAIVTLAEVKAALNIPDGKGDTVLPDMIASASEECDYWCGPTVPRTVTEVFRDVSQSLGANYSNTLWPSTVPVLAVSAETDLYTGQTSAPTLLPDGSVALYNVNGIGPFTLTYVAGRTTVPYGIKRGVVELVRVAWEEEQTQSRPGYGQDESGQGFYVTPHTGIASGPTGIPDTALRHWHPYLRKDGFA